MKELNPEQAQVAAHRDGPLAVLAVAGSGKTEALVSRMVVLVQSGVDPSRILAVTFSKNGADEMNRRVVRLLGEGTKARVGTFHSVGYQILRTHLPSHVSLEVKDAVYALNVKKLVSRYKKEGFTTDHELVMAFIGRCKAAVEEPESLGARVIAEKLREKYGDRANPKMLNLLYVEAEQMRHDAQFITYDDMLYDTVLLLRSNKRVREKWSNRWDYVIQDEAQDQNAAQYELARIFSARTGNLNLIGDPQQTLYGFRGAKASGFDEFVQQYNAPIIRMCRNYRSGADILELAERVLKSEALDPEGKLVCERGGSPNKVEGFVYASPTHEAEDIARKIQTYQKHGFEWHEMAILIRAGIQSVALESVLMEHKIPYHLAVGSPFYKRRDVATLLSYLRIACGFDTSADWELALKRPTKYLTLTDIDNIIATAKRTPADASTRTIIHATPGRDGRQAWRNAVEWADLVDGIRGRENDRADVVLSTIVSRTNYIKALHEEGEVGLNDENLGDAGARMVSELLSRARHFTVRELIKNAEETLQYSAKQVKAKDKVTLTTVHRAKGLEWGIVFLPGVTPGFFPSNRANRAEEARIFYVGVTRAMNVLHVSGQRTATQGESRALSHFLELVKPLRDVTGEEKFESAEIDGKTVMASKEDV
jgi:DNA helicase II / ATP-dependent DNA helicase PcrA